MKQLYPLALLLLAITPIVAQAANTVTAASTPSAASALEPLPPGYKLIWSDEFNGNALDTSKWDYRTDSKMWSTQKPENVSVSNGTLKLSLKKEEAGAKHYSGAGVISKQAFRYGYYEARLKVPPGAGWHTSFWMMLYNSKAGTDREVNCQELDVIENDSLHPDSYGVNVHEWKGQHIAFGGKTVTTPDLSKDFHIFGCEFTPATINYYFDRILVQTVDVSKAVKKNKDGTTQTLDFQIDDQNIWLTSIASALGGTSAVDDTKLPAVAEFDYVRFYEKK